MQKQYDLFTYLALDTPKRAFYNFFEPLVKYPKTSLTLCFLGAIAVTLYENTNNENNLSNDSQSESSLELMIKDDLPVDKP